MGWKKLTLITKGEDREGDEDPCRPPGVSTPSPLRHPPHRVGCSQPCWCSVHSSGYHLCSGLYLDSFTRPSCPGSSSSSSSASLSRSPHHRSVSWLSFLERQPSYSLSQPLVTPPPLHWSKSEITPVVSLFILVYFIHRDWVCLFLKNSFQSLSLVLYTLFPIVLVSIIAGFRPDLDLYYPTLNSSSPFPG